MSNVIFVQSGIPIPAKNPTAPPRPDTKYPFREMKDGDSFFIECSRDRREKIRPAIAGSGKRVGVRVVSRAVTEDGKPGLRFWRVGLAEQKPNGDA